MADYSNCSLDELLDAITTWPVGMPVRAMEQVLARGEVAVPGLRDALAVLAEQEKGLDGKKRPYDLISHLIGCVDSGGADLSERTGENFGRLLRENADAPPHVDAGTLMARLRRRGVAITGAVLLLLEL